MKKTMITLLVLVIFIVIFFGSSKIPDLARTLGKLLERLRMHLMKLKKKLEIVRQK